MKRYFFVLCFLLVTYISNAQVTDTTAYLNSNIAANKSLFINKTFSVLMDSLAVNPISFTGRVSHRNKNMEYSTTFYFSGGIENRILMIVTWDTPINKTTTDEQIQEDSNWKFTNAIKSFYSNKVIKDIIVKGPGI